jgi:hypothetical protein
MCAINRCRNRILVWHQVLSLCIKNSSLGTTRIETLPFVVETTFVPEPNLEVEPGNHRQCAIYQNKR